MNQSMVILYKDQMIPQTPSIRKLKTYQGDQWLFTSRLGWEKQNCR